MEKFLFLLIITLSNNLFAELMPIEEAPIAIKYERTCKINDNGSSDCIESKYTTILTDEGKNLVNRLDFSYREYDTFKVKLAEYFEPNSNKAIPLDKSMIDTKMFPNPDQGFSRDMQTSISFPNLKKGTTIHYITERHYKEQPYYNGFYINFSFYPDNARFDKYSETYQANTPIVIKAENTKKLNITQSPNKKKVEINLKTPYYNNYANENIDINATADITLNIPRVVLAHSNKVEDHFLKLSKVHENILSNPLPKKAQDIVDILRNKSDFEKINAVMEYIYKNYRYLGDWRASTRGHVPNSLKDIVNNGYGDCKDLATIVTAMLRNLNIDAKIAVLHRGDYATKLLIPGFYATNHEIVRIKINNKTYWLDPTNPFFNIEQPYYDIANRWAIILDNDKVFIDNIPENNMTTRETKSIAKLLKKSLANVSATANYSLEPTSFNEQDRKYGKVTINKGFCKNTANELVANSCKITRDKNEFLLKKNYQIKISYQDKQFLKDIAPNTYLYEEKSLNNFFNELKKYKNNNNQADLYMNQGKYKDIGDMLLIGYQIPKTRYCEINSKWFYLKVDTKPINNNSTSIYTEFISKQGWLFHKDIISKDFQDNIAKLSECIKKSNLVIEKEK